MATQHDSGTSFEVCNQQQHFRLLELPPSLLQLITSKSLPNLELKSSAPNSIAGSAPVPANVVLCTENQTFQVRQVQSSNSVFVLQPFEDGAQPSISVSAIAQCPVTLELVPTSSSCNAFLKQSIPQYAGFGSISASSSPETTTRELMLENAPFSSGELDKAWKELCAFELEGRVWLPTAAALAEIWSSTISTATVRNLTLEDGFSVDMLEGALEEDGYPRALSRAILYRLRSNHEDLMDGYAVLDRDKTISWVGTTLLESQAVSANGIYLREFVQNWQNHLPEDWRKHAVLNSLKGKYFQPSKDRIVFSLGTTGTTDSQDMTAGKASGKNARNWHEKFKNARR